MLFTQIKAELSPTEDRGVVMLSASAPEGASYTYTSRYADDIEAILSGVPELRSALMIVGAGEVTRILSFGRLNDWADRAKSQQQVVQEISPKLRNIAGVQAFASKPPSLGSRGFGKPFSLCCSPPPHIRRLMAWPAAHREAARQPGLC